MSEIDSLSSCSSPPQLNYIISQPKSFNSDFIKQFRNNLERLKGIVERFKAIHPKERSLIITYSLVVKENTIIFYVHKSVTNLNELSSESEKIEKAENVTIRWERFKNEKLEDV